MNNKVNFYFEKSKKWQTEMEHLRTIILSTGLSEELKWGCPCYTYDTANVVLIHEFKEYCAILFFKGALMENKEGLLIQQTENVQSARQMRFTSLQEIIDKEATISKYIFEAIEIEKAGLKVELKKIAEYKVPEEFQTVLDEMSDVKTAFDALTPGRQRNYLFYFSQPKQTKTKISRIESSIPLILNGKGLTD